MMHRSGYVDGADMCPWPQPLSPGCRIETVLSLMVGYVPSYHKKMLLFGLVTSSTACSSNSPLRGVMIDRHNRTLAAVSIFKPPRGIWMAATPELSGGLCSMPPFRYFMKNIFLRKLVVSAQLGRL
jgi:hypothetical protein